MVEDRNKQNMAEYPQSYRGCCLIGITNDGLAAFTDGETVYLGELVNGQIKTPPDDYSVAHGIDLEAFEWTVGQYVIQTSHDQGPWRGLTEYARSKVQGEGKNPQCFIEGNMSNS